MVVQAWRCRLSPRLEALLLGYAGAILGALVSGIFDHYWFNLTYPHMTVLFWLYIGMATAVTLIARSNAEVRRLVALEGEKTIGRQCHTQD